MRRREFIALLGSSAVILPRTTFAGAPNERRRVGLPEYNGDQCGRIKWWKSQVAVSAAKSGTRRMKIRFSSGCAIARTVKGKLEQLFLSLSEFRNQQCRFKDKLRHSTTLAIAVNQLSGTFVRSAGLQSFQTSPSCQVSPLSRLAL